MYFDMLGSPCYTTKVTNATFTVGPVFTTVVSDAAAYRTLDELFKHWVKGAEHSQLFKSGRWDGFTHLFTKTHRFPSGLLNEATTALYNSHTVVVNDKRERPDHPVKQWNLKGAEERDYQIDAYETAIDEGRGVIYAAPGGGKTEVISAIIQMLDLPAIVFVHSKTIAQQTQQRIQQRLGVKVGLYAGGKKTDAKIVVATFQSLQAQFKRDKANQTQVLRKWLNQFKVMCIDEAHHIGAKTFQRVANECEAFYRFAFSGTPFKTDDRGTYLHVVGTTGPVINRFTSGDGVKAGVLVPADVTMLQWHRDDPSTAWGAADYLINDRLYTYSGRVTELRDVRGKDGKIRKKRVKLRVPIPGLYDVAIVNNLERNNLIVQSVATLVDDGLIVLVLVDRIDHGEWLRRAIERECECRVEFLQGENSLDERNESKKKLEQRRIGVLIATTIFDEGVDIPSIDGLVFAGGQRAEHKYIQRLGRGQRPKAGKSSLTVIDFFDTHSKVMWNQSKARLRAYRSDPVGYRVEVVKL